MHASLLAELGSWIATHSATLIFGDKDQPVLAATTYWTASQKRAECWLSALKMFEKDFADSNVRHDPWPALEIVMQEILLSELLTRLWSATVATHDWYHQTDELHGLAHAVYIRHQEARNRALRILLTAHASNEAAFDRTNALRRRIERWTDLFLSQLPNIDHAAQFAFDPQRMRDFADENRQMHGPEFSTRQRVLAASFATDLIRDVTHYSANPDLNREIAAGVLACFPSDRFDSHGLPKSVRQIWIEKSGHDTQMLVNHLIDFECEEDREVGIRRSEIGIAE